MWEITYLIHGVHFAVSAKNLAKNLFVVFQFWKNSQKFTRTMLAPVHQAFVIIAFRVDDDCHCVLCSLRLHVGACVFLFLKRIWHALNQVTYTTLVFMCVFNVVKTFKCGLLFVSLSLSLYRSIARSPISRIHKSYIHNTHHSLMLLLIQ